MEAGSLTSNVMRQFASDMRWRNALGRVVGATLFVLIFNAIAFAVFLLLPPLLGLAWVTLLILSFIWWHLRRGGDRSARIALVRLYRPTEGALAVMGVAASLLIAAGIAALIRFIAPELEPESVSAFHEALLSYEESVIGSVALLAALALLGPLVEEFGFRGYVQHTLEDLVGPGLAIGLGSVVFALAHLGASHWSFFFLPLAIGCASGVAVYLFNSIWVGVAIHAAWNLAMAAWARAEWGALIDLTESSAWWPLIGVALIGVGLAAWIVLWKAAVGTSSRDRDWWLTGA